MLSPGCDTHRHIRYSTSMIPGTATSYPRSTTAVLTGNVGYRTRMNFDTISINKKAINTVVHIYDFDIYIFDI